MKMLMWATERSKDVSYRKRGVDCRKRRGVGCRKRRGVGCRKGTELSFKEIVFQVPSTQIRESMN